VANLRDIKRRITSVQSTQKITRAMKMVAAAKLRSATDAIAAARPYAERMRATLEEVSAAQIDTGHALFEQREEKKHLEVVVITSDRGLAGAFNSAVLKRAEALIVSREGEFESIGVTLIGKKAGDFFKRRRPSQISDARAVGPNVNYLESQQIAQKLIDRFEAGEVDEVTLVYSQFVSIMTQQPVVVPMLPIAANEADDSDAVAGDDGGEGEEHLAFEVEPSTEKLLAVLVPKAVEVEVFRSMLENQAGEHAARMTAMENATKNSGELIDSLTLEYNRARQAAITRELVEIVTGAQALE